MTDTPATPQPDIPEPPRPAPDTPQPEIQPDPAPVPEIDPSGTPDELPPLNPGENELPGTLA